MIKSLLLVYATNTFGVINILAPVAKKNLCQHSVKGAFASLPRRIPHIATCLFVLFQIRHVAFGLPQAI